MSMSTLDLFRGLAAQQLIRNQDLLGRINALIYAKQSGLTAEELGQSFLIVNQEPAPAQPPQPPPVTPAPAPAPGGVQFWDVEEQEQPDGTWREISRTPIQPTSQ